MNKKTQAADKITTGILNMDKTDIYIFIKFIGTGLLLIFIAGMREFVVDKIDDGKLAGLIVWVGIIFLLMYQWTVPKRKKEEGD